MSIMHCCHNNALCAQSNTQHNPRATMHGCHSRLAGAIQARHYVHNALLSQQCIMCTIHTQHTTTHYGCKISDNRPLLYNRALCTTSADISHLNSNNALLALHQTCQYGVQQSIVSAISRHHSKCTNVDSAFPPTCTNVLGTQVRVQMYVALKYVCKYTWHRKTCNHRPRTGVSIQVQCHAQ